MNTPTVCKGTYPVGNPVGEVPVCLCVAKRHLLLLRSLLELSCILTTLEPESVDKVDMFGLYQVTQLNACVQAQAKVLTKMQSLLEIAVSQEDGQRRSARPTSKRRGACRDTSKAAATTSHQNKHKRRR